MPKYMYQVSYTSESWATQVASPQDREQQVGQVVERLGGKIETFYYAFGEYDIVLVADFPDDAPGIVLAPIVDQNDLIRPDQRGKRLAQSAVQFV